jgi:hypothetical protein
MQPCAQRLRGATIADQLFGEVSEVIDLMTIHSFEQGFACRKMPIERADPDAGSAGDGLEARLGAAHAENLCRSFEQKFAIADRVGTQLASWFCGFRSHYFPIALIAS